MAQLTDSSSFSGITTQDAAGTWGRPCVLPAGSAWHTRLPPPVTAPPPRAVLPNPSTNERTTEEITDLGEAGYRVLRPIPVEINRIGPEDYQASWVEANIAIAGRDSQDAYQALVAEILDTFDTLAREPKLCQAAARQRQLLLAYIARA